MISKEKVRIYNGEKLTKFQKPNFRVMKTNNVSNNLTEDCDLEETVDTGVAGFAGQVIDFYVTTKEECLAYCVNEVCLLLSFS